MGGHFSVSKFEIYVLNTFTLFSRGFKLTKIERPHRACPTAMKYHFCHPASIFRCTINPYILRTSPCCQKMQKTSGFSLGGSLRILWIDSIQDGLQKHLGLLSAVIAVT